MFIAERHLHAMKLRLADTQTQTAACCDPIDASRYLHEACHKADLMVLPCSTLSVITAQLKRTIWARDIAR